MNLKKIGKLFTSKFIGTGPWSYKKEFTGPRSRKSWETLLYETQKKTVASERNETFVYKCV